ncbi:MAG: RIP metalloprotease RseP [Patescibacteria group bacterium]|nr:RIP metalloprotease RseP [Patescibacteria group bacterium]
MLIFLIVFFGLSLLILGHEAGHFFAAKMFGVKVEEFGFGFPPRIFAWRPRKKKPGTNDREPGETEYSINWLPFGGFVRISGERGEMALAEKAEESLQLKAGTGNSPVSASRLFYAQPAWKKSIMLLAGVIVNFILGWLFISIAFMIGTPKALVVGSVEPNSPAAAAGLVSGDVIKNYTDAQSFSNYINAHRGEPTQISVDRNGKAMDFTVTPRVQTAPNEGAIGVGLAEAGSPRESAPAALWDGLQSALSLVWLTVQAFWQLIVQLFVHASLLPGVAGPVGIFGIAEETGSIGLIYLLQFIGIISINLMVVNCIPFPALDGGRFVMVLIEKIKGSAVPEKVEVWINGIGFALLLVLMVLLTVRDVRGLI